MKNICIKKLRKNTEYRRLYLMFVTKKKIFFFNFQIKNLKRLDI